MSKVKSPFEFLSEEDLARIEMWLANPDPTIESAAETLELDEEKLRTLYDKVYDVGESSRKPSGWTLALSRAKNLFIPILTTASQIIKSMNVLRSVGRDPELIIRRSSAAPLNDIHKAILESRLIESSMIARTVLKTERSALTAFGDPPIIRIEIHLDMQAYDAQGYVELIEALSKVVEEKGGASLDKEDLSSRLNSN